MQILFCDLDISYIFFYLFNMYIQRLINKFDLILKKIVALNMADRHNLRRLKAHILDLSEADLFNDAKLEWKLDEVCVTQEFGQCPCGVRIKEHCYLKNDRNGNTTWVGNVCVKRFMDIDASSLFKSLRRVRNNNSAKPNTALIEYAWRRGNLYTEKEYEFLTSICGRRRRLSEKQLHWLQLINRRIIESIVVREIPDQIVIANPNPIDDDSDDGDFDDDDTDSELEN